MLEHVRSWGSKKFFTALHGNKLVYNQCWEDPRVDREALQIQPEDRIMVITSAGCNALDYALCSPKHVYAVDINPRQNALLELKLAGIRSLSYADFFSIFGNGHHPNFEKLYAQSLRSHLPLWAREFWDSHQDYFSGSRSSFFYRGTSGFFASLISKYIDFKGIRTDVLNAFNASDLEEQARIYNQLIDKKFWDGLLVWLLNSDSTMAFLGVPLNQRRQVEIETKVGIAGFMQNTIRRVFTEVPLADNYFYWSYITGSYSKDRCPEYLKESQFFRLKAGLVDKVSTHNGSVLNFCNQSSEKISKFVLLDHMDWMGANALGSLQTQWNTMLKSAAPECRFIWRSGASYPDFMPKTQLSFNGRTAALAELLKFDVSLAQALSKKDRVQSYAGFFIGDLPSQSKKRSSSAHESQFKHKPAPYPLDLSSHLGI